MGELLMAGVILALTFIRSDYTKPVPLLYKHPSFKPVEHTIITAAMWAPYDRPYLGQSLRTKPNRHRRKRLANSTLPDGS